MRKTFMAVLAANLATIAIAAIAGNFILRANEAERLLAEQDRVYEGSSTYR